MTPIPICMPLHGSGGKFGDNTELRQTLRSYEAHLQFAFEIVIVGPALPKWGQEMRLLKCDGGLKRALVAAAEAFPAGFFWCYDDCVALRDTSAELMKVTAASKGWRRNHNTWWSRDLDKVRERLEAEGRTCIDFSRQHGAYWFDKGMIDEAFADWPGMAGRFPFESWILSKRDWPRRFGVVKQYYGAWGDEPGAHHWFVNWNDKGLTDGLLQFLRRRFPRPSKYEADHPVPWPATVAKVDVHTIRFGDTWWLRMCAPTLDAWAERHGHRLRIWGEGDIDPSYPAAKFCEVDMLREFLAGDAELLLYVDADIYVDPSAPPHPEPSSAFLIREDLPGAGPRDFRRWGRRHGKPAPGWVPRNAGVWQCTREGARRLLEVIEPPYIAGCQEQHQWNWWLHRASAAVGLEVGFLPAAWNSWAYHPDRGAFYHLAGKKKSRRVRAFRANGLIPSDAVAASNFPRTFDDGPFAFTSHDNGWDTDGLHIHALHLAAGLDIGKPGPERVAVEVGAFRGRSTAALVAALHKGLIGHLHVVEIRPTDSLRRVLAMAPAGTTTLHTKPFWDTAIGAADLVFIDGDHKWPAVGDTMRALTWGANVIACHDSQSWPKMGGLWGSHLAGRMLKDMPGRTWVEDAEDRPGQRTFRGFLVSAAEGIDLDPLREFFRSATGDPLDDSEGDDEAEEEDDGDDLAEPSPESGDLPAGVAP